MKIKMNLFYNRVGQAQVVDLNPNPWGAVRGLG